MAKTLMSVAASMGRMEYRELFWLFTYGKSRERAGMRGQGEGSLGTTYGEAAKGDGYVAYDEAPELGSPTFADDGWIKLTRSLELKWSAGENAPLNIVNIAKIHLIKNVAICRNHQDVVAAFVNGYPVTQASMFGLARMVPPIQGDPPVRLGSWDGQWAHQTWLDEVWEHPTLGLIFRFGNNWSACYSPDTDVLTEDGWKPIGNVPENIRIATLNPETHTLEYQLPTEKMSYDYSGDLIQWNSRHIDLLVTPNHNMFVARAPDSRKFEDRIGKWRLIEAQHCPNQVRMKKNAKWNAPDIDFHYIGGTKVRMDDWLEFLGYYISEGHCSHGNHMKKTRYRDNNSLAFLSTSNIRTKASWAVKSRTYQVQIAQITPKGIEKIQSCLDRLPFHFRRSGHSWICNNKSLWNQLRILGKSATAKHLPFYAKNLSTGQSRVLMAALMVGDGTIKKHQEVYYTSSWQLANDVQELLLKAGACGDIGVTDRIGRVTTKIKDGKTVTTRNLEYRIGINRFHGITGPVDGFDKIATPYTGKVHCLTVPNHIIYVRRNGKPVWCGNSAHGAPTGDEPAGGFYITASTLDRICRGNEVLAFSDEISGFPARTFTWD